MGSVKKGEAKARLALKFYIEKEQEEKRSPSGAPKGNSEKTHRATSSAEQATRNLTRSKGTNSLKFWADTEQKRTVAHWTGRVSG